MIDPIKCQRSVDLGVKTFRGIAVALDTVIFSAPDNVITGRKRNAPASTVSVTVLTGGVIQIGKIRAVVKLDPADVDIIFRNNLIA